MALIKCSECGREISDKASNCIGCGAPVAPPDIPKVVLLDPAPNTFVGTKSLVVQLAAKAIVQIGWKLDGADEQAGIVTFTTGVTWGSWSGVSGSIYVEALGNNRFRAMGSAKQNVRGGAVLSLNLFNEAESKANRVIEAMRQMAAANEGWN